jgi:hypothetical protein
MIAESKRNILAMEVPLAVNKLNRRPHPFAFHADAAPQKGEGENLFPQLQV